MWVASSKKNVIRTLKVNKAERAVAADRAAVLGLREFEVSQAARRLRFGVR
jgi:hypothetical protein